MRLVWKYGALKVKDFPTWVLYVLRLILQMVLGKIIDYSLCEFLDRLKHICITVS